MEAASPRSIYASENDDTKGAICLTYIVYHSAEGCIFEALYPAPSARPFFKGLLSWHEKTYSLSEVVPGRFLDFARNDHTRGAIVLHTSFCHSAESCLFEALYPPPSARPFFKGLLSWEEFFETQSPVTSY